MLENRNCYHQTTTQVKTGYIAIATFQNHEIKYETKFKKDAEKWLSDLSWLEKNNEKAIKKNIQKVADGEEILLKGVEIQEKKAKKH